VRNLLTLRDTLAPPNGGFRNLQRSGTGKPTSAILVEEAVRTWMNSPYSSEVLLICFIRIVCRLFVCVRVKFIKLRVKGQRVIVWSNPPRRLHFICSLSHGGIWLSRDLKWYGLTEDCSFILQKTLTEKSCNLLWAFNNFHTPFLLLFGYSVYECLKLWEKYLLYNTNTLLGYKTHTGTLHDNVELKHMLKLNKSVLVVINHSSYLNRRKATASSCLHFQSHQWTPALGHLIGCLLLYCTDNFTEWGVFAVDEHCITRNVVTLRKISIVSSAFAVAEMHMMPCLVTSEPSTDAYSLLSPSLFPACLKYLGQPFPISQKPKINIKFLQPWQKKKKKTPSSLSDRWP